MHDPLQYQRHGADAGVGFDVLGLAMKDRGDFDHWLEHPDRHAHRLLPAQGAQLGVGVAQAVEVHHADDMFDCGCETGATEEGGQRVDARFVPQRVECPDITERQADSKRT